MSYLAKSAQTEVGALWCQINKCELSPYQNTKKLQLLKTKYDIASKKVDEYW